MKLRKPQTPKIDLQLSENLRRKTVTSFSIKNKITGKALDNCRSHLLDQSYMSGIQRDQARIRATAEIFTPNHIVEKMLRDIGDEKICDPQNRIIDPACGDGQFLAYILWHRISKGVSLNDALSTLHGIDIMTDNVDLCRHRLSCGSKHKEIQNILKKNIIKKDALKHFYTYLDEHSLLTRIY